MGWGFFLAKPQRTQRNKHGLAQTTKQSVLVCERPWQMITATDKHGLARTTFSASMDIFRGFMVSFYVKGKENGHGQAYAPNGAMVLK